MAQSGCTNTILTQQKPVTKLTLRSNVVTWEPRLEAHLTMVF